MNAYEDTQSADWDRSDSPLISSERVTGTSVYNSEGDKLGSIETVMIDKLSGQVRFAVMSFGGFLGIGEKYHQLPWEGLRYDEEKNGYLVNISRAGLEGAPVYDRDQVDNFDYGTEADSIDDYYEQLDGFYSPEQQSRRNAGVQNTGSGLNRGTYGDMASGTADAYVDEAGADPDRSGRSSLNR